MLFEFFKFSISTILVGGAAILYSTLKYQEENHRKTNELDMASQAARQLRLEEFLREFTDNYNKAKFIRRELKHELVSDGSGAFLIRTSQYEELMRELNQVQLKFELFRRLFESRPSYLFELSADAALAMEAAEGYLGRVTAEYEDNGLEVSTTAGMSSVSPKSKLFQFSVKSSNSDSDGTAKNMYFASFEAVFSQIMDMIKDREEPAIREVWDDQDDQDA